ncbi:carbohydrate kinase family protein [Candidatus Bipolaricaulota bacterium]|nr:carbohydrate kinase family protein [Candidatus Bipolaricaulota bacterium]
MNSKLVSIGDINWDVIVRVPGLPGPDGEVEASGLSEAPGGDACNVAVAFSLLGGRAGMIGAVGQDPVGEALLQRLSEAGVDTAGVRRVNAPTGRAFSLVEPGGERRLFYLRGANSLRKLEEADLQLLGEADWIFLADPLPSTVAQLGDWLAAGKIRKGLALDPGSGGTAKGLKFFSPLLPHLSVLFLNEPEALALSSRDELKSAVQRLLQLVPLAVVKRGRKGALAASHQGTFHSPALPVRAVDTTGCGDAFNAAFLLSYIQGSPLQEALIWGNAAGAITATRYGARMPTRKELEELIKEVQK